MQLFPQTQVLSFLATVFNLHNRIHTALAITAHITCVEGNNRRRFKPIHWNVLDALS